MQIYQVVVEILTENHSKKCMKIGHLRAIFSPWRRRVGKNLMRRTGKRIYRRFWISNQIFDSIYGSRDMALSLDTTFGIFGQNRNFVDEYLKNGIFVWHAVFAGHSEMISVTFWPSFIEILNVLFEKKSKNPSKMDIFALYGWSRFFLQNRASSLKIVYNWPTWCKKSEKSLKPFLRFFRHSQMETGAHCIEPSCYIWVQKTGAKVGKWSNFKKICGKHLFID